MDSLLRVKSFVWLLVSSWAKYEEKKKREINIVTQNYKKYVTGSKKPAKQSIVQIF